MTRTLHLVMILVLAAFWLSPATVHAADSEEAQFNVVVTLYNAGQWEAAIKKIEEREQQDLPDPMRARYLYVKGLAYEQGDKAEQAQATYAALIEKHPDAPEAAKARLAKVYLDYAQGNHDGVIEGYGQINRDQLGDAAKRDLTLMYAEALAGKDQTEQAAAAYQAALELGADRNAIAPRLFDLYLRAGDDARLLEVSAQGVPGVDAALVALARAEALLAADQFPQAAAEAAKVPKEHEHYARAQYAQARALMAQDQLKQAAASLSAAMAGLKDPQARLAAGLALVSCLLQDGQLDPAEQALAEVNQIVAQLPAEDQAKVRRQVATLAVRVAAEKGDAKRLTQAVEDAREQVAPEDLPTLLYIRLYALEQAKDDEAILATMAKDLPALQGSEHGPAATFMYTHALKRAERGDEAVTLLEQLLKAQPAAEDALLAHLELANLHLDAKRDEQAAAHLAAITSAPQAGEVLDAKALQEIQVNQALLAQRQGQPAQAVAILEKVLAGQPDPAHLAMIHRLLGQAHLDQKEYAKAAQAWTQGLEHTPEEEQPALRDQIARALMLAEDYAGAETAFDALAQAAGGADKLSAETLALWARALYAQEKHAEAAAVYQRLYEQHGGQPDHAYEAAAAHEAAGDPAQAAAWYEKAAQGKDKLSEEYAQTVAALLAKARMASGTGDLGRDHWLGLLEPEQEQAAFDRAVAALAGIVTGEGRHERVDDAFVQALGKTLEQYQPSQARYYSVGGVLLAALDAQQPSKERDQAQRELAVTLTAALAEHEADLEPEAFGATVAPAMIHFFAGEAARRQDDHAQALLAYETVLSVYPYNQWPDAAAVGAAQCFLAFGDKTTALARLEEVIQAADASPGSPASKWWRDQAAQLIQRINQGESP